MKIIKFNESLSDSEKLSALRKLSEDINLFKEKFKQKRILENWFIGLDNDLGELEAYEVFSVNDYGRYNVGIGYVKGMSSKHARIVASIEKNNSEIFTTGFYDAKKITKTQLEKKIESLEKEINLLKSVL
jgi:hypothetical protein